MKQSTQKKRREGKGREEEDVNVELDETSDQKCKVGFTGKEVAVVRGKNERSTLSFSPFSKLVASIEWTPRKLVGRAR
jgi:hypothetical protein